MEKYREAMYAVFSLFPHATDIQVTVTTNKWDSLRLSDAIMKEIDSSATLIVDDKVHSSPDDRMITEVVFPLIGKIKVVVE